MNDWTEEDEQEERFPLASGSSMVGVLQCPWASGQERLCRFSRDPQSTYFLSCSQGEKLSYYSAHMHAHMPESLGLQLLICSRHRVCACVFLSTHHLTSSSAQYMTVKLSGLTCHVCLSRVILECQIKTLFQSFVQGRDQISGYTWCTSFTTQYKHNNIAYGLFVAGFPYITIKQTIWSEKQHKNPNWTCLFFPLLYCWYQICSFYFCGPSRNSPWNHQSNNNQWCCEVQLQVIAPFVQSGNPTHAAHTLFPATLLLWFTTNDWLSLALFITSTGFTRNLHTCSLLPCDSLWLCCWPGPDVSLAYRRCLTRHGSYLPFVIPPRRTINSGLNDIW